MSLKIVSIAIFLLLFCNYAFAELVYIVKIPSSSTLRVTKVKERVVADEVVYITDDKPEAMHKKNFWYFTEWAGEADLEVCFGDYYPVKIYFAKYRWEVK